MKEEYFAIGTIHKCRGLKGEIQLYFDVENPQDYEQMESVFIEINNRPVPFFISKISIQKNIAYLYLEGIDHVDEARKLLHKKVLIAQDQIPENTNDDLPAQLTGFYVIDAEKGELGKINEIQVFPSQYIASVTFLGKEVLFPINDEIVTAIDTKTQEIRVNLPEGLIDLYLTS